MNTDYSIYFGVYVGVFLHHGGPISTDYGNYFGVYVGVFLFRKLPMQLGVSNKGASWGVYKRPPFHGTQYSCPYCCQLASC